VFQSVKADSRPDAKRATGSCNVEVDLLFEKPRARSTLAVATVEGLERCFLGGIALA
jgi:hypothetical protein